MTREEWHIQGEPSGGWWRANTFQTILLVVERSVADATIGPRRQEQSRFR